MKTTYLTKQHQRALFYLECIDRVMKIILYVEDRMKEPNNNGRPLWRPFYNKEKWAKKLAQQKEFSIWLMTRYNKVIDNITAHSYAK